MHSSCALRAGSTSPRSNPNLGAPLGCCEKWRRKMRDLMMISANNPLSAKYFRSEISIREEKERQLNSNHYWVIHPLSKFRAWYDILLVFIHLLSLFGKPIDAGFARGQHPLYWGHRHVSIIMDMLCWLDICMNFSTGFIEKRTRKIEMDPKLIAKHYMQGPFFIFDLLSSLPRNLPYFIVKYPSKPVLGVINICLSLRCFRIMTLMSLIYRITQYFEINKSKGLVFLFCSILVTMIVVHWLACLQHIVPRLTGRYFMVIPFEESWIYQDGLYTQTLQRKYRHAFFKASAEILAGSTSSRSNPSLGAPLGCCQKWRRKMRDLIMISANNPLSAKYFRSEISIREEKERQLNSNHYWVIHPLSKFRAWYDILLVFIHLLSLFGKPIDAGFSRGQHPLYWGHRQVSIIIDMLCWLDICMNFSTGFIEKRSRKIKMDPKLIARHYMRGPFFIFDLLSSFPRNLPYFIVKNPPKPLLGVINICLSLRCFRIMTLMSLIYRITKYFEINKSKGLGFLCSILVTVIVIHWLACLQHIVPRLTGRYFMEIPFEESWIYQDGLYTHSLRHKYRHAFFKASAEILGMRLTFYRMTITADYVVAIITYILGKILMISIWIILAIAILNYRSMEIKYEEIINQLTQYMKQKQLPFNLTSRISQYYNFKYQKKYFKEEMISDLLSEHLREEVNLHVCKSLIASISIFGDLTPDQLSRVVAKLIPEIFLPGDTIVQSGSPSESMFFLSSGTVAVYTHSGKEVCHLQDGAYFGEVCLVLKNLSSVCTIVAIEITQVYRLKKRDFERTLMKNKVVYNKIIQQADARLKLIHQAEEVYKRELFEKSFQTDMKPAED